MSQDFKINVSAIVRDHLRTLVDARTGKAGVSDWFSFLIVPIAGATMLVWKNIFIANDIFSITITGFAIFVGLLLNVMVILFDIVRMDKVSAHRVRLVRETSTNIAFCILLSILAILSLFLTRLDVGLLIVRKATHHLAYFLLIEFVMGMLMILKRIYTVFIGELHQIEVQHGYTKNEVAPRRGLWVAILFYILALLAATIL